MTSTSGLTIGVAARQTGIKVPTIRYYEEIGLLPPSVRTESNRRVFNSEDIQRLAFIRHARELGFEIEAIRTLLDLQEKPDRSCSDADSIARKRLADVESRIQRLTALKNELERMISQCQGGQVANCHIIEVLADHSHGHCLTSDHELAFEQKVKKKTR